MRGDKHMDGTITFRASREEIAAYNRTQQQLGFNSKSEFHRAAGNKLVNGNDENLYGINPIILMEANTHLDRLNFMISELLVQTANDNFPDGPHFAEALNKAISDIKLIKRKVS